MTDVTTKTDKTDKPAVKVVGPSERKLPEIKEVQVNDIGFFYRNLMVHMPEGATQDDLRDPKIWRKIQIGPVGDRLRKYDHLFILAFDESWCSSAVVSYADNISAALVLLKVGSFRDADKALYSDGIYRVMWMGTGFGIERVKDGVPTSNTAHSTEALAIDALKASPKSASGRLEKAMDRLDQPALGSGAGAAGDGDAAVQAAQRLAGYDNARPRAA